MMCRLMSPQESLRKGDEKVTNSARLKETIHESGLKISYIAKQLGLSRAGFYNKLEGKRLFNQEEIKKLCIILQIKSLEEKEKIFFN